MDSIGWGGERGCRDHCGGNDHFEAPHFRPWAVGQGDGNHAKMRTASMKAGFTFLISAAASSGCAVGSAENSSSGFALWSGRGVLQIGHQEMYFELAEKPSSASGKCITLAARDTRSARYFESSAIRL